MPATVIVKDDCAIGFGPSEDAARADCANMDQDPDSGTPVYLMRAEYLALSDVPFLASLSFADTLSRVRKGL